MERQNSAEQLGKEQEQHAYAVQTIRGLSEIRNIERQNFTGKLDKKQGELEKSIQTIGDLRDEIQDHHQTTQDLKRMLAESLDAKDRLAQEVKNQQQTIQGSLSAVEEMSVKTQDQHQVIQDQKWKITELENE